MDTKGMWNGASQLDRMVAWEEGQLDEADTVELFQELIDSGLAWRLQGSYGRMANALIAQGLCQHRKPTKGA
jgi:hypothetical protein